MCVVEGGAPCVSGRGPGIGDHCVARLEPTLKGLMVETWVRAEE